MPIRELIMLGLMCLVWGLHIVLIAATAGKFVDPIFYAACRMTLVAAILSPLLRLHKGQMKRLILGGFLGGSLTYALMFTGLSYASASAGAMAMELYVPFTTIMAVIFLKEHIGLPRILGMIVAIAGVGIIALSRDGERGEAELLGIGLLVLSMVSEAVAAINIKKIDGVRPMEMLGWFALIGAVVLWLITFTIERDQLEAFSPETRWQFIGALLTTVFGASLFGHTTYYWLIKRLPVSVVSSSTMLATLVAVAGGVILLGEPLTWQFLVGGAMTLGGVGVILLRTNKPKAAVAVPLDP